MVNGPFKFSGAKKLTWKSNLPLAVTTSVITGVYSYTMIDKSTNNAVNRALLMTLSTLLGASVVDVLASNGYLDSSGNGPMAMETVTVPLIYYWINNRQFKLPDTQSDVLKAGFVSSIAGQLLTPYVQDYMNNMNQPKKKEN